jgi:hypothetical protein
VAAAARRPDGFQPTLRGGRPGLHLGAGVRLQPRLQRALLRCARPQRPDCAATLLIHLNTLCAMLRFSLLTWSSLQATRWSAPAPDTSEDFTQGAAAPAVVASCAAGGTAKQKGAVSGVLAVLGVGSVLSGAASVESVLNAGIAAVSSCVILPWTDRAPPCSDIYEHRGACDPVAL